MQTNNSVSSQGVFNYPQKCETLTAPPQPSFSARKPLPFNLRIRNWRACPPGKDRISSEWYTPRSYTTTPVVFDNSPMEAPPAPKFRQWTKPAWNLRTRDWLSQNKFSTQNFSSWTNQIEQKRYENARELFLTRGTINEQVSYETNNLAGSNIPNPPALPMFNSYRQSHSQLVHPHRTRPMNLRTRDWKTWNGSYELCNQWDLKRDQAWRSNFWTSPATDVEISQTTVTYVEPTIVQETNWTTIAPVQQTTNSTLTNSSVATTSSAPTKSGNKLGRISSKLRSSFGRKHAVSEPSTHTQSNTTQTMTATPVATPSTYAPAANATQEHSTTPVATESTGVKHPKMLKMKGLFKEKVGKATKNQNMMTEGKRLENQAELAKHGYGTPIN